MLKLRTDDKNFVLLSVYICHTSVQCTITSNISVLFMFSRNDQLGRDDMNFRSPFVSCLSQFVTLQCNHHYIQYINTFIELTRYEWFKETRHEFRSPYVHICHNLSQFTVITITRDGHVYAENVDSCRLCTSHIRQISAYIRMRMRCG